MMRRFHNWPGTTPLAAILLAVLLDAGLAVAQTAQRATENINALLCSPTGWEYEKRLVSLSRQTRHVRGSGSGLLFAYTRRRRDLWQANGEFKPLGYRPRATKQFPRLDLSAYNELSFWAYVEGNVEEGFRIGFTGPTLRTSLRRNEWVRVRWHFAEDERLDLTQITSFFFQGMNQGTPPTDPQEARIYLSGFRLEKATPKHVVGWRPDPAEIVLPYCGVRPGEKLIAPVAACHAGKRFSYSGPGKERADRVSDVKRSPRTEYAEIRLRAPKTLGKWRLKIEDGPSATLFVAERPYDEAVGKALTAVRAQRCGCASELHGPCHRDDAVRQDNGQAVDVAGGWHDEGASQFVRGTVLTTAALARYRCSHSRPYRLGLNEATDDDLLAEVEWGARTLLKYEIEPGLFLRGWVRPYWCHTDSQPGTGDERRITVHHFFTPLYRWTCIEALALCSCVLREPLKTQTRVAAKRLWAQAERVAEIGSAAEQEYWGKAQSTVIAKAAQLGAAVEMLRLTGEAKYADAAVRLGNRVLALQDRSAPKGDALYAYFYRTSARRVVYNGTGNSRNKDLPGRPLAELLMVLPSHANAPLWREALTRYAEGTLKPLARVNAPYGALAAGPFKKPIVAGTTVPAGERRGDALVYPVQITSRGRRGLGSWESRAMFETAAAMAAMGRALGDDELVQMAHGAVRYVLGANPFHVSYMRHFGDRWPHLAQMPNVPGMTLMFLGFTLDGRPYYNPYGTSANSGHARFHVRKEGTTYTSVCLMLPCSYLEGVGP